MEHDGVGDMEVDVNYLSDTELSQKLRQLGANIGPITDSTRAVYQRKLQRWLHFGPTADTSMLESSPVELRVNVAAQREVAAVDIEPSVFSSRSVGARNGPTSSNTKMTGSTKAAMAGSAAEVPEKHDISPIRMSRSDVIPQVQPFTLTFAECGSEACSETANGLSEAKRMMKPKVKPVTCDEPIVTADDIVNRAVGVLHVDSATPASSSSYASTVKSGDEEAQVRRRYSTYSVSSRPSLNEYKSPGAYDGPSCLPDLDDYRLMMSAGRRSTSFSTAGRASLAEGALPAEPRQYCDTTKLVWCLVIVVLLLFIAAVIYNMEPAFINPVEPAFIDTVKQ